MRTSELRRKISRVCTHTHTQICVHVHTHCILFYYRIQYITLPLRYACYILSVVPWQNNLSLTREIQKSLFLLPAVTQPLLKKTQLLQTQAWILLFTDSMPTRERDAVLQGQLPLSRIWPPQWGCLHWPSLQRLCYTHLCNTGLQFVFWCARGGASPPSPVFGIIISAPSATYKRNDCAGWGQTS